MNRSLTWAFATSAHPRDAAEVAADRAAEATRQAATAEIAVVATVDLQADTATSRPVAMVRFGPTMLHHH